MDKITARLSHQGFMFILSSPSGAGKTTIARHLLEIADDLAHSISVTTRPRRASEAHSHDYHFVDDNEFASMVQEKQFLEHARVMNYDYGTPKAPVMEALQSGQDVIFDIDWQGAQQLKQHDNENVVSIFILPPSWSELERRLRSRNQDHSEVIEQRMAQAEGEISHWHEYDYIIINEDIDESVNKALAILQAERLRRARQPVMEQLVRELIAAKPTA